eukprot:5406237-Amphidinium_carterae.1
MLAGGTPEPVHLGKESDGPPLPGLSRAILRELQVQHLPQLFWPNSRQLHGLEELRQIQNSNKRQKLELVHAPSICPTSFTSRTSLDDLADGVAIPSAR